MSVEKCIAKLVAVGVVNRQIADEALALYERSRGEYAKTMGPAQADAAAALAAARAMEAGAKKLKNDTAKQALAWAAAETRILEHPRGPIAGIMSMLTRDIWEKQRRNVSTETEINWGTLSRLFHDGMKAYAPGMLGQSKEQLAGIQNMVRELFGVDTGDRVAKAAAKGWADATGEAVARVKAAGRNLAEQEDWRLPQFWDQQRVRKFGFDEFKRDVKTEIDQGALVLWDRDTGKPVTAAQTDFVLDRAYRDIITNDGGGGAFNADMRTFQFEPGAAGGEAWLRLQGKYATGDNIMGMLTGHLQRMAREIALAEVIGPNHGAIVRAGLRYAREQEGGLSPAQRLNPLRMLESAKRIEQTYDVLTGRANAVEGPLLAGVMGGLRSINTAAKLQAAVLSAVPGDSVTAGLAASYAGMPVGRLFEGVFRELARGGEESKALAARMHLVAHAAMDYSHGLRFFQDQIGGPEAFRWLGTTMIRAQGLQAWTELMKRTFTMEMMGHLADMGRHSLDDLRTVNKATADFLERAQITAAEWDAIRATPHMETDGVRFLDLDAVPNREAARKLLGAVIDERAFAVLEPDARVRALTTGGLPQGTFWGEAARSVGLFKSFSLTMGATHMMRLYATASEQGLGPFLAQALPFVLFGSFAGAAAIQAKNIVFGKDPQDMRTAKFWAQSFLQGGGVGIYGDMLNSAFTKGNQSFLEQAVGPVGQVFEDVRRLTFAQARKAYEGDDATFGAEAVKTLRRYTPGVFYTRLAVDRLLFDQIQTLVDPDYRGSFRRMEQRLQNDTGQEFWFRPGHVAPSRAPDLGAAIRPQ